MENDTWGINDEIPTDKILANFQQHSELRQDNQQLWIPLHEEKSAELTGEYVILRKHYDRPTIFYFDVAREKLTPVQTNTLGRVYIGYRIRFWHPDYTPPETPSFLTDIDSEEGGLDGSRTEIAADNPASEDEMDQLYDDLVELVETNDDSEREERRKEIHDTSIDRLERQRVAVSALTARGAVSAERDKMTLRIESEAKGNKDLDLRRDSDLRYNVEVVVGKDREEDGLPFDARIADVFEDGFRIKPDWGTSDAPEFAALHLKEGVEVSIVELHDPLANERKREAIDEVWRNKQKREIIGGRALLNFDSALTVDFDRDRLNNYQQQAAEAALRSKDVFCIHGPPGTGKTRTLATIIREAVKDGKRVLACAHSNQAVDNLLATDQLYQADLDGELRIARDGHRITDERVRSRFMGRSKRHADIVGATTNRAANFRKNEFDLCVIDEATQADIPSTLIPFYRSEQLILAGDHKQLPPHCSDEDMRRENMHRPLFERLLDLYDENISVTLRRQYRMNGTIAGFSNQAFYDGKLEDADQNAGWTVNGMPPMVGIDIRSEEDDHGTSKKNHEEAQAAVGQAKRLLNNGVDADDIGIIAMYNGQVTAIKTELQRHEIYGVKVSTVDSFQGSEKEAIIVSFVRSNSDMDAGFLEFKNEGPRRLNVALTRAKKRCVLIGNWKTLTTPRNGQDPAESCADVYLDLYSYIQDHGKLVSSPGTNVVTH
ncbi:DEAD/DEAH box helicase [Natrialba swarupiae]|nr:AAA domain-containing protein [Natrialba swarupiae]